MRVWTAERLVALCGVNALTGTPWACRYARAVGCTVGQNVQLDTLPPLTGLATFEDDASLESEVDVAGYWVDGGTFTVGYVHVGVGALVGTRSTLMAGARLGAHSEIEPGACVEGVVPPSQKWAGSPARQVGVAGEGWPACRPARRSRRWDMAYAFALFSGDLLPLVIRRPGRRRAGSVGRLGHDLARRQPHVGGGPADGACHVGDPRRPVRPGDPGRRDGSRRVSTRTTARSPSVRG